jgi:hypothetical protein
MSDIDPRIMSLYGFIGLVILLMFFFILWKSRRSRRQEASELDDQIKRGLENGRLVRDEITGEPYTACIVCKKKATRLQPVSGTSWMDDLPLLNRLNALAPRYVIEDKEVGEWPIYCDIHYQQHVVLLEKFHSELRKDRADFNARQSSQVTFMDDGGITQEVIHTYQEQRAVLKEQQEKLKVPQLPASSPLAAKAPPTRGVLSVVSNRDEDNNDDEPEELVANDS